jgi:hypothetical protein
MTGRSYSASARPTCTTGSARRAGGGAKVRRQTAEIHIEAGSVTAPTGDGPFQIADGWLQVAEVRFDDLIPAPLTATGAVQGQLELVNGPPLVFTGAGVRVRLTDDGEFVEVLPPEWAPVDEVG